MQHAIEDVTNSIARKGALCPDTAIYKTKVSKGLGKGATVLQTILGHCVAFGFLKTVNGHGGRPKYYAVKHTENID